MFVITTPGTGHCVINGLGEVKVFATKESAERVLEEMREYGTYTRGFEVRQVQFLNY